MMMCLRFHDQVGYCRYPSRNHRVSPLFDVSLKATYGTGHTERESHIRYLAITYRCISALTFCATTFSLEVLGADMAFRVRGSTRRRTIRHDYDISRLVRVTAFADYFMLKALFIALTQTQGRLDRRLPKLIN